MDMEKKERETLHRVDERTELIYDRLDGVNEQINNNQTAIDNLEEDVGRNTTILNAVTLGLGSLFTIVVTKVSNIIHLLT